MKNTNKANKLATVVALGSGLFKHNRDDACSRMVTMINKLRTTTLEKRAMKKNYGFSCRRLFAAVCSAVALVITMPPFAANAATIYKIVNNPAVQDGYTLSGTITTDGKTGAIYASNVLAWSFLVSNGVNTYSANSSQPGSSVSVDGIVAMTDYLELPSSTVSNPYGFSIVGATSHVQWTGSTLQNGAFTSASEWNSSWPWWQDYITTTPHDVPGGWAIADNGTPVPVLNLRKAVYVDSSNLKIGASYQLQISTNLNTWTNSGTAFTATNSTWRATNYWDVDGWSQLFFRLQVAP
jgi:hypothetical protein